MLMQQPQCTSSASGVYRERGGLLWTKACPLFASLGIERARALSVPIIDTWEHRYMGWYLFFLVRWLVCVYFVLHSWLMGAHVARGKTLYLWKSNRFWCSSGSMTCLFFSAFLFCFWFIRECALPRVSFLYEIVWMRGKMKRAGDWVWAKPSRL